MMIRCLIVLITFMAMSLTAFPQALIEHLRGPHVSMTTNTLQPLAGESFVQHETGIVGTRITDQSITTDAYDNASMTSKTSEGWVPGYSRYTNINSSATLMFAVSTRDDCTLWDLKGKYYGVLRAKNGWRLMESRDPRWDRSGKPNRQNWIAYLNGTQLCEQDVLIGPSSEKVLYKSDIAFKSKGDGDWNNDFTLFSLVQVVQTDNGKDKREIDRVSVFDRTTGKLLPGFLEFNAANSTLNGTDVSPSGEYLVVGGSPLGDNTVSRFYAISDLRQNTTDTYKSVALGGGHGGWAIDYDGKEVYVWWEHKMDWFMVYKPSTGDLYPSMYGKEIGWGSTHIASIKNFNVRGWYIVSTYPSSISSQYTEWDSFKNQVFAVQLGRTNKYQHPAFSNGTVSNDLWRSGFLPDDQQPLIQRFISMQNKYVSGRATSYWTEGMLCIDYQGTHVAVGSNWHANDNLETYWWLLPQKWWLVNKSNSIPTTTPTPTPTVTPTPTPPPVVVHDKVELYAGATVPEWDIVSYSTDSLGCQFNMVFMSNQALGDTTRGNYAMLGSYRTDSFTYNGKSYTSQTLLTNGVFDMGLLLYWNTSKIPKSLKLKRAYIGLSATDKRCEGGNNPVGREQVQLLAVNNVLDHPNIWTNAHLIPGTTSTVESNWDGASWRNWRQDDVSTQSSYSLTFTDAQGTKTKVTVSGKTAPWSLVTSSIARNGSGVGRYGNLSTSCEMMPNDPRISFNPDAKSMSYSDDITTTVQGWITGKISNYGLFINSNNALNSIPFGDTSNAVPKWRMRVGVQTPLAPEYYNRPRLVLEFDTSVTVTPTPTPTPVATPTPETTDTTIHIIKGQSVTIVAD